MDEFELDLDSIEEELDIDDSDGTLVLGILDGSTPDEQWIQEVARGHTLLLAIEGELNDRASGFAREIKEAGGSLVHFREFLVVAPPGVGIDMERL